MNRIWSESRGSALRAFSVSVALLVATFAWSCSGGGANKSQTPSGGGATPQATVSPELQALTDKFAAASFKADYNLTSTGSDSALDGTMTMYKNGSDKFRFDVKSKQDGQDVSITLIETSDTSAFCLDNAGALGSVLGVDSGQGVCFQNDPTSGGTGSIKDLASTFEELSSTDTEVLGKSSRQIIGRDAQCYQYRNTKSDETSNTCFSADGIPLYDKTDTGTDSTTVEATSVSASVQQTDFDLPYEVKDFPDVGDSGNSP